MSELLTLAQQLHAQLRVDPRRGVFHLGSRAWIPIAAATGWLTELIYARFFVNWREDASGADAAGDPQFTAQLAKAAGPGRCLDAGWRVTGRRGDGAFVSTDGIQLWVADAGGLVPRNPRRGQAVRISMPCVRDGAMPGFFVLVSRRGRISSQRPHLKLYLNLRPEGAPALIRLLARSRALATARFEAKVVNDPRSYGRRDTALLYVDSHDAKRVCRAVLAFHRAHRRWFRAERLPLTFPLAAGVSAGESTSSPESYGEQRCRLLAEGILEALGDRAPFETWERYLAAAFAREGLDVLRPWRGRLRFDWSALASSHVAARGRGSRVRRRGAELANWTR